MWHGIRQRLVRLRTEFPGPGMRERLRMQRIPLATGAFAIIALLAAQLSPRDWREAWREESWRELAFDLVLAGDHRLRSPTEGSRVVVVDIDRRSLEALGPWPWPRARIAALVEAVVAAKPAVIAIDILFAQQDVSCFSRANPPGNSCDTTGLAGRSNEGDQLLAREGLEVPLVLGFLLDPQGKGPLPNATIHLPRRK